MKCGIWQPITNTSAVKLCIHIAVIIATLWSWCAPLNIVVFSCKMPYIPIYKMLTLYELNMREGATDPIWTTLLVQSSCNGLEHSVCYPLPPSTPSQALIQTILNNSLATECNRSLDFHFFHAIDSWLFVSHKHVLWGNEFTTLK